jgi:hypothetical protein
VRAGHPEGRIGLEGAAKLGDRPGCEPDVCVDLPEYVPGLLQPLDGPLDRHELSRRGEAVRLGAAPWALKYPRVVVRAGEVGRNPRGGIGGPVVHEQQLIDEIALRRERLEQLGQVSLLVQEGNDDADDHEGQRVVGSNGG